MLNTLNRNKNKMPKSYYNFIKQKGLFRKNIKLVRTKLKFAQHIERGVSENWGTNRVGTKSHEAG